ncbi:MAG: hypothetical protein OEQ13_01960, partial [Acidobacteriota bacterium]|nr:hypothetical protein [Acidobacteriota bacterium]
MTVVDDLKLVLGDGTSVRLRLARPADNDGLLALWSRLSDVSRRTHAGPPLATRAAVDRWLAEPADR